MKYKYIIFSFDMISAPIAEKLQSEGCEVLVAQIQDVKELGFPDTEKPENKAKRLKLYSGILKKEDAKIVLKALPKIQNKDEYFIIFDFNNLWNYGEQVLQMGFKNIFAPTKEQFDMERDRLKGKEFVEKYYKNLKVAEVEEFKTVDDAIAFLEDTEEFWVLKSNSDKGETFVPSTENIEFATEMIIDKLKEQQKDYESAGFILERKIPGIREFTPEMMFWNGEPILSAVDIEYKHIGAGANGSQVGCFDRETEILTKEGWKKFTDLDVNKDTVANLDYENKKVIYSPVLDYIQYHFTGKMHSYQTKHMDMIITPNHRIWGRVKGSPKMSFIESQNLVADISTPVVFFNDIESQKMFKIEDKVIQYKGKKGNGIVTKTMKGLSVPFIDWAKFLGLWISEGHITLDTNGKLSLVGITQMKKENISIFEDIIKKVHPTWFSTGKGWGCGKSTLAEHLLNFSGRDSYTKRIPPYIKESSKEIIRAFLDSYILGDGNVSETGKITIYTVNKLLADDLMEVCIKAGYWSSIRERQQREWKIQGKNGWSKKQYEVSLWRTETNKSLGNLIYSKGKRTDLDFDDDVFCVTTQTGIILVRRNGKASWIGNCGNNLIIKVDPEEEVIKMAFPPVIYEMAKKHPGLFVWDASILYSPEEDEYYFGEFCANRVGWDSIFSELSMAGGASMFFERIAAGENPLSSKFGVSVRGFNADSCEDSLMLFGKEGNIWVYDRYLKKGQNRTTGLGKDLVVFTGASNDPEEAVDEAYEALEEYAFNKMQFRPKFDFLTREFDSSIVNRYETFNHKLWESTDFPCEDENKVVE